MTNEQALKNIDGKMLELLCEMDIASNKKWKSRLEKEYSTLVRAKEAIEKQIAVQVNISLKGTTDWNTKCHCPACRADVFNDKYCRNCGQRMKG